MTLEHNGMPHHIPYLIRLKNLRCLWCFCIAVKLIAVTSLTFVLRFNDHVLLSVHRCRESDTLPNPICSKHYTRRAPYIKFILLILTLQPCIHLDYKDNLNPYFVFHLIKFLCFSKPFSTVKDGATIHKPGVLILDTGQSLY